MAEPDLDRVDSRLTWATEGRVVYDRDHRRVGEIVQAYAGTSGVPDEVMSAKGVSAPPLPGGLPPGLAEPLAREGFIEISAAPRLPHRYASSQQIAAVDSLSVHLSVGEQELPAQ